MWGNINYGGRKTDASGAYIGCSKDAYSNVQVCLHKKALAILRRWYTGNCGWKGYGGVSAPPGRVIVRFVAATQNRFSYISSTGSLHYIAEQSEPSGYNAPPTTSGSYYVRIYTTVSGFAASIYGKHCDLGKRKPGGCLYYNKCQGSCLCAQTVSTVPGDQSWPSMNVAAKDIFSTDYGFIALYVDGTVHSWGYEDSNRKTELLSKEPSGLDNIMTIYTTGSAVVLDQRGSRGGVGKHRAGGCEGESSRSTYTCMPRLLGNVRVIYSNPVAFCAVHNDRTVTCWGDAPEEYVARLIRPRVRPRRKYVRQKAHLCVAGNGGLKPFGDQGRRLRLNYHRRRGGRRRGGQEEDTERVFKMPPDGLDAVAVVSTEDSFTALASDGTLHTWGASEDPPESITEKIVSVFANEGALPQ